MLLASMRGLVQRRCADLQGDVGGEGDVGGAFSRDFGTSDGEYLEYVSSATLSVVQEQLELNKLHMGTVVVITLSPITELE